MRAGLLDRRVKLYGRQLVDSTVGPQEGAPALIAEVAAKVLEGAGKEFLRGGEWQAESRAVMTIRWRADVDETVTVEWAGKRWAVSSVRTLGRKDGLELLCTNRGEVAP